MIATSMGTVPSTQTDAAEVVRHLVADLRGGDVRALARAISLVENDAPEASRILSMCFPHSGHALRIGLTGPAGSGKSTLADRVAGQFRDQGETVGIVAVDPTSPFTGGAILGDRIRMQHRNPDPGIYMRSMATRGALGGLASATADVASVIEASGKTRLLIETVGVGQDEVDVVRLADVTIVVLVPGLGDDIQSMKAGILEIADIFVVNKFDREGADRVEREICAMQALAPQRDGWVAPVVRTVATTGEGVIGLMEAMERCTKWLQQEARLEQRRSKAWQMRLVDMIHTKLVRDRIARSSEISDLQAYASAVSKKQQDPYLLVDHLMHDLVGRSGLR